MKRNYKIAAALALAAAASGCANPGYYQQGQGYPNQQGYPSQQSYPNQSGYQQSQSYPPPASSYDQQSYSSTYGVVDSIQAVQGSRNASPGLGTVAGVVVGGLLGNQIGGGSGRALATVAGAVGGGVVGNNLESNNRGGQTLYQVGVRLDNGTYSTVTQDNVSDIGIGNRVRIDNGRVFRY